MAMSILDDKSVELREEQVREVLGRTFASWEAIKQYVSERCGEIVEEWNFPGAKYGWSLRLKFKKRNILYLIPCRKHFMVAFVFGDRAVAAVEAGARQVPNMDVNLSMTQNVGAHGTTVVVQIYERR